MVGVPDGIGEQVACAVVPDLEHDPALSAAEVTAKVEEHFRKVSADLPFWKRVRSAALLGGRAAQDRQALDQAPRGGGRDRAAAAQARGEQGRAGGGGRGRARSPGCSRPSPPCRAGRRSDVQLGSRFGELGLRQPDVRRAVERARRRRRRAARQRRHHDASAPSRSCTSWLARGPAAAARELAAKRGARRRRGDPRARRRLVGGQGGSGLGAARSSTSRCCDTRVKGESHIPQHTNFIVAANHARTSTWGRSRSRSATRAAI